MENLETMIQKGKKPYYRPDLERLLNNLGVTAGDTLILHTSLKSFGYLIGGAAMLIDTVLNCIGPEGTLVMPSQSVNNMNPKFWQYPPVPQDWHDDIRETMLPYDPQRTPVDDALGAVVAYFYRYPNVHRSAHPLYSFCAYGRDAEKIVENHPLDYGLGTESPLQKLYDAGAKILMLGTTFETNTSLHLAEYFVNRPDIEESAPVLVDGKKQWVSFKNVDLDIFDDFLDVQKEFFQKYADQIKQCSLPNGEAYCFSMRDCVDFAKAYYQVKG